MVIGSRPQWQLHGG